MSDRAPYSRVYWSVMDDPKFDGIREDPRHLGSWCLLLIVADMAWPAPAFPPPAVSKASMKLLVEAGLVDPLTGGRFRIHGLDAERGRRRDAATSVGRRYPSGTQTGTEREVDGPQVVPKRSLARALDETRLDETRRDKQTRPMRKPFADPLLEEIRAAQLARYGGEDQPLGPEPPRLPTAAEQERETHRLEALDLHDRFVRGDLGTAEYERLRADVGKEPDDLTRLHA